MDAPCKQMPVHHLQKTAQKPYLHFVPSLKLQDKLPLFVWDWLYPSAGQKVSGNSSFLMLQPRVLLCSKPQQTQQNLNYPGASPMHVQSRNRFLKAPELERHIRQNTASLISVCCYSRAVPLIHKTRNTLLEKTRMGSPLPPFLLSHIPSPLGLEHCSRQQGKSVWSNFHWLWKEEKQQFGAKEKLRRFFPC